MDVTKYAKFGMDRFSFTYVLRKGKIGRLDTSPHNLGGIYKKKLYDLLGEAVDDNGLVEGFILLGEDLIELNGIKPNYLSRIKPEADKFLRDGQQTLAELISEMKDDDAYRQTVARVVARLLSSGINMERCSFRVACPCYSTSCVALVQMRNLVDVDETTKIPISGKLEFYIPGSYCALRRDFRDAFDAEVHKKFAARLASAIKKQLPRAKKRIATLQARLETAQRYVDRHSKP